MTNTPNDRDRATRQGQIYARELFNEEPPELLPIWLKIQELVDKFEVQLDEMIEELALDKITGPASIDDEDADEIRDIEFRTTKFHLMKLILMETLLESEVDDQLEYNPIHGMVYDLRDPN